MSEVSRIIASTLSKYVGGAADQVIRNRKILAMLKAKGRISFNHSGKDLDWGVRYKEHALDGYADGGVVTFARSDHFLRAVLPWRGYIMSDVITEKEKLMNRGKEALIKFASEMAESLTDSVMNQFPNQVYVDGNAAGNTLKFHGFDSFTGASVSAGNFVATPNDTYAGLATNLADKGGTWSGTWPSGSGDSQYDYWAPIVVDYTNTGWAASTKTWPNTAHEAIRYGIIKSKRNDSKKGMLDCIILEGELYRQWLNLLDDKERIIVGKGKGAPSLYSLGFDDVQNFEGTEVTWEFGVPNDANGVAQGYGFNFDEMELMSLFDVLFKSQGPHYDETTKSDKFTLSMWGNFRFNPRYFAKYAKYS